MGRRKTPDETRFWAKVQKTDTCWLWTASKINGFGQFRANGHGLAVQFSWELHFGPLPVAMRIKQTCGNRACVNPAHLTTGAEGRFWIKVDKDGPIHPRFGQCWMWTGAVKGNTKGYGYGEFMDDDGRFVSVHRYSYALEYGPINPDLEVDHICRNRLCVRPEHLRASTHKQNMENQGPTIRSRTGVRGVYVAGIDVLTGVTWYGVLVGHNGTRCCGGFFTDIKLAEEAAVELRNRLFTHNDLDR
jgi:hypothetical protein